METCKSRREGASQGILAWVISASCCDFCTLLGPSLNRLIVIEHPDTDLAMLYPANICYAHHGIRVQVMQMVTVKSTFDPQGLVTTMIADARSKGELWSRKWDRVPIPALPAASTNHPQRQPVSVSSMSSSMPSSDLDVAPEPPWHDRQPVCNNYLAAALRLSSASVTPRVARHAPQPSALAPVHTSQLDSQTLFIAKPITPGLKPTSSSLATLQATSTAKQNPPHADPNSPPASASAHAEQLQGLPTCLSPVPSRLLEPPWHDKQPACNDYLAAMHKWPKASSQITRHALQPNAAAPIIMSQLDSQKPLIDMPVMRNLKPTSQLITVQPTPYCKANLS